MNKLIQEDKPTFRDRTEREFAGYTDAIDYLTAEPPEPLGVALVLHIHRRLLRDAGDPHAGRFKTHDNAIGKNAEDGRVTVVFKPVPAGERSERHMQELVNRYEQTIVDGRIHPLVLIHALVLDFLAIHPFADGGCRAVRLLTTRELLRHSYGIARHVSLEQRILESKNSYCDALRASQLGWHESEHDLWPRGGYLPRLIGEAYDDFERRVVADRELGGATKAQRARDHILNQAPEEFRIIDLDAALPDISFATLKKVLGELAREGRVKADRGRSSVWRRIG